MNTSHGADNRCAYMRISEAAIHARTVELGMMKARRALALAKAPAQTYDALRGLLLDANRASRLAEGAVAEVVTELRGMPPELASVATALLVGVQKNAMEAERAARFVAALTQQAAPPLPALEECAA